MEKEKRFGQVFTPTYLVQDILDFAGYRAHGRILRKHIIDNSCGDGAFLAEIVRRYSAAYRSEHGTDASEDLAAELAEYIHGIEIDAASHSDCLKRLDAIVGDLHLPRIEWDVRNADAMNMDDYDGRMDFVVGNPPYVRVHNLDDDFSRVKQYSFCSGGMTDLYLVFYELGLKMLSPDGILCYIAPSSWFNSVAGKNMREYLQHTRCLTGIIDLQHFQPFKATAYTAICRLENGASNDVFAYGVYDGPGRVRFVCDLKYSEAFFDDALYLGEREALDEFRIVKTNNAPSRVTVKNGFATLADDVFIADDFPFEEFVIPVIKASTGKWRKALYPYDKEGRPLPCERIFGNEAIAEYLYGHKDDLLKGRNEAQCSDWFRYGRSQALKDVWSQKFAVNTVVRDVKSLKFNSVPSGSGVYSGLYILSDLPERQLRKAVCSEEFISYVSMLRKYKSGGYYTFNSKDLKKFLDYSLDKKSRRRNAK